MSLDPHKAATPEPPRTLIEAHNALVQVQPKSNAPLAQWRAFYQRSVVMYRQIAEIDRGHHHEALYWAEREQVKLDEVTARINGKQPQQSHSKDAEKGEE